MYESLSNSVATPFCGHGDHTAPYVRSGVIAKDAVKKVAAIATSNSVNIRLGVERHRVL